MKNKKTIKKVLIILLIAVALLILYSLFASQENSRKKIGGLSSLIGSGTQGQVKETDVTLANAEILKILGSIQNIELQDDIFVNPIFKELKDTHFSIPKPVKIGRTNPFRPIGYEGLQPSQAGESILDDINQYNNQNSSGQSFFENTQSLGSNELENLDALDTNL